MPQFDPAVYAPQIVWLVIAFGILYLLMARFVLPGIGRVLEERVERVAEDLDQAESLKLESERVRDALDAELADARRKATAALAEATARARKEGEEKLSRLDEELAGMVAAAEARIHDAQVAAIGDIGDVAADACRAVVAKLAAEEITETRARKAVSQAMAATGDGAS